MDKLRVGVVVFQEFNPTDGGAYSYQDLLLKSINEYQFDSNIEIINIIFYNKEKKHFADLKKPSIYIKSGVTSSLKNSVKESSTKYFNLKLTRGNPVINFLSSSIIKARDRKAEEILRKNRIDLIYYLRPEWEILNYPFIATHWDNCHKSIPPFPEVALDGMYEKRERYHSYILNKALVILCESHAGVDELHKYNRYDTDKVKVLPIFAGDVINESYSDEGQEQTLSKFKLQKNKYFLYPAQFWAHKNHYNLIIAFKSLIEETKNNDLKLVLCGSDKGNIKYIKELVTSLSLTDRILIPGFVSVKELNHFYKNALALVMPTFLGPTNMPLIEAAHLKCPVACSNLDGHREILGDNAVYFPPKEAELIKEAMIKISDDNLRSRLSQSAHHHIHNSSFNMGSTMDTLNKVLVDTIPIRKTWGY